MCVQLSGGHDLPSGMPLTGSTVVTAPTAGAPLSGEFLEAEQWQGGSPDYSEGEPDHMLLEQLSHAVSRLYRRPSAPPP
jgi:hypothetical protein